MPLTIAAIALLYLALLVGLVWAVRRKRARAARPSAPAAASTRTESDRLDYLKRSGLYWGVTLQTPEGHPGCPRVQELLGREFTLDQAPRLPLPGCTLDCQCHYHPLLEQRSGTPRRVHHDRRSILRYEPGKKNRRQLPTRRQ